MYNVVSGSIVDVMSENGDTKVPPKNFYKKCDENNGEAVEMKENISDEVETVPQCTYLDERVSAGGECETAVSTRTCGWAMLRECGESQHGKKCTP